MNELTDIVLKKKNSAKSTEKGGVCWGSNAHWRGNNYRTLTIFKKNSFNRFFLFRIYYCYLLSITLKNCFEKKNCSEKSTEKGGVCWGSNAHQRGKNYRTLTIFF